MKQHGDDDAAPTEFNLGECGIDSTGLEALGCAAFHALFHSLPAAAFVLDPDGRVRYWNHACETLTGVPAAAVVGTGDHWKAFHQTARPMLADALLAPDPAAEMEYRHGNTVRPAAHLPGAFIGEAYFSHLDNGRWLSCVAAPVRDKRGDLIGAIEILHDITQHRRAEFARIQSEKRLAEIIDGSPVPTFVIDANHKVVQWNHACEQMVGTAAGDMIGTRDQWRPFYPAKRPVLADLVLDGGIETRIEQHYGKTFRRSPFIRDAYEAEGFFSHFPGGGRWLFFTAAPLHDAEGRVIGAVETLQDVTERKRYEDELRHNANHDELTGLVNRRLLIDRIDQALAGARRDRGKVGVIFIDLDNFKTVNDSLGHEAGDQLIRHVARRLSDTLRDVDTVARLGGDEFVIVIHGQVDEDRATRVVMRVQDALAEPCRVQGQEIFAGCSIGIAIYPRDGEDSGTLLKNADAAMYRAKELGRNGFQFFRSEINTRVSERMALEQELRAALKAHELDVHYQPQVDIETGRIVGAEALLRWNSPRLGPVSPARFIPIAEDSGLILPIGQWVLETACQHCRQWVAAGWRQARMSVNLSARQFRQTDLYEMIADILSRHSPTRLNLELEITESLVMTDPERAINAMCRLKALGVQLALDDFGTGYSSLSQLRHLPLDILKVDQAFVRDIGQFSDGEALVAAVISMGRVLGKKVVAEGVETEEQLAFLRRHGCHEYQGFLFSPAVPSARFCELLRANGRITEA